MPERLDPQARPAHWPERYPGSFAAGARIVALREELRAAERWVAALDEQCHAGHVALDRLRLNPDALDQDADALDHHEEELGRALEAREQAAAERDRLAEALAEAEHRDLLGLPPVADGEMDRDETGDEG